MPTFFNGDRLDSLQRKIKSAVIPIIEALEAELIDVEIIGGSSNRIYRFFVDKRKGVTVNECAEINKKVCALFEGGNIVNIGSYRVEVSSPGIGRPFKEKKDYLRNSGKKIRVVYKDTEGIKKKIEGSLEEVNDSAIIVLCGDKNLTIPYQVIIKARQAIEW